MMFRLVFDLVRVISWIFVALFKIPATKEGYIVDRQGQARSGLVGLNQRRQGHHLMAGVDTFLDSCYGRLAIGLGLLGLPVLCFFGLIGIGYLSQPYVDHWLAIKKSKQTTTRIRTVGPPDEQELTISLTCQRLEPSLPVTCEQQYYSCTQSSFFGSETCNETQTKSFELRGAKVGAQFGQGTVSRRILLETDEGAIYLNDCSLENCTRIRNAIIDFVENRDEGASFVLGESILTIKDGRLTYEP